MKKILITGGCGFIGFNLVANLMKSYDIVIIDDLNSFYSPEIKKKNWDILEELHNRLSSKNSLELIIDSILNLGNGSLGKDLQNFDYIIHLAAQPGVRESFGNKQNYLIQNVQGTRKVLEFAKKINPEKLINFSSSTIYGLQKSYPFVEDMIPHPISPYGESKYEAEKLCSQFSKNNSTPIYTLRPFSIYGPQLRPRLAISSFFQCINENKTIIVNGTGEKKRDFTYISDLILVVKSCLTADLGEGHHIFNVGNGNPVSINELILKFAKLIGKEPEIIYKNNIKGEVDTTWASLEKISTLLKFYPRVNIEDGLKNYIKWQNNPNPNQILIK